MQKANEELTTRNKDLEQTIQLYKKERGDMFNTIQQQKEQIAAMAEQNKQLQDKLDALEIEMEKLKSGTATELEEKMIVQKVEEKEEEKEEKKEEEEEEAKEEAEKNEESFQPTPPIFAPVWEKSEEKKKPQRSQPQSFSSSDTSKSLGPKTNWSDVVRPNQNKRNAAEVMLKLGGEDSEENNERFVPLLESPEVSPRPGPVPQLSPRRKEEAQAVSPKSPRLRKESPRKDKPGRPSPPSPALGTQSETFGTSMFTRESRRRAPPPPPAGSKSSNTLLDRKSGESKGGVGGDTQSESCMRKGAEKLKLTFGRSSKREEVMDAGRRRSASHSVLPSTTAVSSHSPSSPGRLGVSEALPYANIRRSNRMQVALTDIVSVLDGSKKVHVFVMEVTSPEGDTWKVARRYNNFLSLHHDMQPKTSRTLTFPPKKLNLAMDESKLKKRKMYLQKFMNEILEMNNLSGTVEFMKFLDPMESPSCVTLSFQETLMSGVLMQKVVDAFNLEWHERWVVIVNCVLFYYKDKYAAEPVGQLSLDYCMADLEDKEPGKWCFGVKHLLMESPIIFEANTEEMCKKWIHSIRQARSSITGALDDGLSDVVQDGVTAEQHPAENGQEEVQVQDSQGVAMLRRYAYGKSVRLSTFATVPDTVSSMLGSMNFGEPDSESNVVLKTEDHQTVVVAGTIEKLIEKVTDPGVHEVCARYFILTYRSSLTPQELLAYLVARYHHVDLIESKKTVRAGGLKRNPIQDRVVWMMQLWLDLCFYDFVEDSDLTRRLLSFVYGNLEGNIFMNSQAEIIKEKIKLRIVRSEKERAAEKLKFLDRAPQPIIPKMNLGLGELNYMVDMDPLELARQITILDHELFSKIQSSELVGQKWSKEKTKHLCPNVMVCINRFNAVASFVQSIVLEVAEASIRAAMIGKFIEIGRHLIDLRSYGPACAVVGGLFSPPLMRLKKTNELLSEEIKAMLKKLEKIISTEKNHQYYRRLLEKAMLEKKPSVPYLGLFLSDLTFIEDGNTDVRANGGLINFEKRAMIGKVLSDIIKLQTIKYCLKPLPAVQYYLQSYIGLNETQAYNLSLEREPREQKKVSSSEN